MSPSGFALPYQAMESPQIRGCPLHRQRRRPLADVHVDADRARRDREQKMMNLQDYHPASGWQNRAACAGTDPALFFPDDGGSSQDALNVCRSCLVRQECLASAIANDEPFGIWGGLTMTQRRGVRALP